VVPSPGAGYCRDWEEGCHLNMIFHLSSLYAAMSTLPPPAANIPLYTTYYRAPLVTLTHTFATACVRAARAWRSEEQATGDTAPFRWLQKGKDTVDISPLAPLNLTPHSLSALPPPAAFAYPAFCLLSAPSYYSPSCSLPPPLTFSRLSSTYLPSGGDGLAAAALLLVQAAKKKKKKLRVAGASRG